MNKRTALAATLLVGGVALGASPAVTATAVGVPGGSDTRQAQKASTAGPAQDVGVMASCASQPEDSWYIPDGEGHNAGVVYWHDYNHFGAGSDQDNFKIDDGNLDGQSSSLWVKNNWTGKTYYKHAYNGDAFCIGVGNIPDGATASWKACGWDDGEIQECSSGRIEE